MIKAKTSSAAGSRIPAGSQKRTEMISVRLALKLRYAADIAARSQRRTLSSLVEVAVAAYLPTVEIVEPADYEDERPTKLMKLMETLRDPQESDRFVLLAENGRWLLNNEEELRWKAIQEYFNTRGQLTSEQRNTLRPIYDGIKEEVAEALYKQETLKFAKG